MYSPVFFCTEAPPSSDFVLLLDGLAGELEKTGGVNVRLHHGDAANFGAAELDNLGHLGSLLFHAVACIVLSFCTAAAAPPSSDFVLLLDGLADELEEPGGVLVRLHCGDAIDIGGAVLDRLGHLGGLLLHAVVGEDIDLKGERKPSSLSSALNFGN